MLTAVAWTLQDEWKDELIVSVNYGFPKTAGNSARKAFVNSMDGLGIWRVANGIDLVPRTPPGFFALQFDKREARAFWLHEGDTELGYRRARCAVCLGAVCGRRSSHWEVHQVFG